MQIVTRIAAWWPARARSARNDRRGGVLLPLTSRPSHGRATARQDRRPARTTRENRDDPHPSPRSARCWLAPQPLGLSAQAGQAQQQGKVIYFIPTLLDEFQSGSRDAFQNVLGAMGYEVTSLDAQNRADLQLNQLEDAINTKPDAIIMNAVDFDAIVPGHREGARGRHQGAELRPADPFHAVRPDLGRGHGRDRPSRGRRGDRAADGEVRQPEGQDAADPGRPRRHLHARHPEGLRGGDGQGGAGRRDHQQGRRCCGSPPTPARCSRTRSW